MYFAHALEILLHTVVEEDVDAGEPTGGSEDSKDSKEQGLLSGAIEFLDHFDDALDVVVGCARKIEMTRWPRLFDIVGNPKILFEVCGSYYRSLLSWSLRAYASPACRLDA